MDPYSVILIVVVIAAMSLWGAIIASMYRKCGPHEAMIITGFGAGSDFVSPNASALGNDRKIVIGGGSLVIPVLQQYHCISLEIVQLPLKVTAITKSGAPVDVTAMAQLKVPADTEHIIVAAENFAGKSQEEILRAAETVLMGSLLTETGKVDVEEIYCKFDAFGEAVREAALPALKRLGLTVVNFDVIELRGDYISELGKLRIKEILERSP